MNYCSECGKTLIRKIPPRDVLPRFVCENCHAIHYQNPKLIVGCIPEWQDKILLCQRAIEPRYGLWTLPAGFMENNETVEEAAKRETWEEAHAKVHELQLYTLISLPHISQVYMVFRASLCDLDFSAGEESLKVELFKQQDIPWDTLAFPVIQRTLGHYFEDRAKNLFSLHVGDIIKRTDK
jgi:ADP-ribose pyrophosphatase YjhB (NUDIX family)